MSNTSIVLWFFITAVFFLIGFICIFDHHFDKMDKRLDTMIVKTEKLTDDINAQREQYRKDSE